MQPSIEPQPADVPDAHLHGAPQLTCEKLVDAITDYLEGAMAPDDLQRLELHLSFCPPCQLYLDQMKLTIAATGRLRAADVSAEAETVLMALFRAWAADA